jgi:hypothetical protein
MNNNDELIFADESEIQPVTISGNEKWKVLVVDDDTEVHSFTTIPNLCFEKRGFESRSYCTQP